MSRREQVLAKRDEILELAARHGASDVRLFGSVARGDEHAESDVDFLVRMGQGRSLFDVGGLLMDLQDLLGCKVDLVTEHRSLKPRFREAVASDLIRL